MWSCDSCGCQMIAASITACPMCRMESFGLDRFGPPHKAREEDDMGVVHTDSRKETVPVPVKKPKPVSREAKTGEVSK